MSRPILSFVVLALLALSSAARGDVVTEWNAMTLQIVHDNPVANLPASRMMAMVHTSMFDAINAVSQGYTSYSVNAVAPTGASAEAAGAAAAYRIMSRMYPGQIATLNGLYNTQLAAIPDGQAKTDGIALGVTTADSIYTWRSTDHAGDTAAYAPTAAPGRWQPTPPAYGPAMNPQWPTVTPWTMTSGSQFRQAGPPSLDSSAYATDYNQTRSLGDINSVTRTAEQTAIAQFYADMPGRNSPLWHWNQIAQGLSLAKGFTLQQNARMFAVLDVTLADGMISAWDMKYFYDRWRPVTAIRAGDTDGNPSTTGDPNWTPLLTTPAFQEYISTHSLLFAAGAEVLAWFNGDGTFNDNFTFTRTAEQEAAAYRTVAAEQVDSDYWRHRFSDFELSGVMEDFPLTAEDAWGAIESLRLRLARHYSSYLIPKERPR